MAFIEYVSVRSCAATAVPDLLHCIQGDNFELRGEAPPQLLDGSVVEARVLKGFSSSSAVPLVRGEVRGGSFNIVLPEKLEPELLSDVPVSCGGTHKAAFVSYPAVLKGEASGLVTSANAARGLAVYNRANDLRCRAPPA